MTDPIKAKIQSLCPDVMEWYDMLCGAEHEKDITLAVVLRAIVKIRKSHGHDTNWQVPPSDVTSLLNLWNLEHDNYDQQSEECKQFIGSLSNK